MRKADVTVNVRVQLTQEGIRWAADRYQTSLLARVAILGYHDEWPDVHVTAAIEAVNTAAKLERLEAEAVGANG